MSGREELVAAYLRLHPEAAARLLESMPADQANAVLSAVDAATAAPVVGHMLPTCAAACSPNSGSGRPRTGSTVPPEAAEQSGFVVGLILRCRFGTITDIRFEVVE